MAMRKAVIDLSVTVMVDDDVDDREIIWFATVELFAHVFATIPMSHQTEFGLLMAVRKALHSARTDGRPQPEIIVNRAAEH